MHPTGYLALSLTLAMLFPSPAIAQGSRQSAQELRKTAEQGDAAPQCKLAFMYHQGQRVMQKYAFAHAWYHIATRENPTALSARDSLAAIMTPEELTEAETLARRIQQIIQTWSSLP